MQCNYLQCNAIIFNAIQLFAMQCNYLQCNAIILARPPLRWAETWSGSSLACAMYPESGWWWNISSQHIHWIFSKYGCRWRLYLSIDSANRRQEEGLLEGPETTHGELQRLHLIQLCAVGTFLQLKPQITDLFCLCPPPNYCLHITFSKNIYDMNDMHPDTCGGGRGWKFENLSDWLTESRGSVPGYYQI